MLPLPLIDKRDDLTPFHYTCSSGHEDTVEAILSTWIIDVNRKNNNGETPFRRACQYNYKKVVELLLSNNIIDVNCKDNRGITELHYLCKKGY